MRERRKRLQSDHLTAVEIEQIRKQFLSGKAVEAIALAANCSDRAVYRHTQDLRTVVPRQKKRSVWETPTRKRQEAPRPAPAARPSRFYTSNFEPS